MKKSMRNPKWLPCVAAGIALILFSGQANATESAPDFVQKATIGNQFEISASRLALQTSQNDSVKQFAQQMVDDHTRVGDQLKTTLSQSDADIPVPNNHLDQKHQDILDKLNKASAKDFDRQYVNSQVDAHKEAVSLFRDYSKHGDNGALKSFAAQTLPTLKDHQKHVLELKSSL